MAADPAKQALGWPISARQSAAMEMKARVTQSVGIVSRPSRARWAVWAERLFECIIRVSGVSAVIFVVAIFLFIFREALPVLRSPHFHLGQFLFSTAWYPTSVSN